jgi:hypothetical protein
MSIKAVRFFYRNKVAGGISNLREICGGAG